MDPISGHFSLSAYCSVTWPPPGAWNLINTSCLDSWALKALPQTGPSCFLLRGTRLVQEHKKDTLAATCDLKPYSLSSSERVYPVPLEGTDVCNLEPGTSVFRVILTGAFLVTIALKHQFDNLCLSLSGDSSPVFQGLYLIQPWFWFFRCLWNADGSHICLGLSVAVAHTFVVLLLGIPTVSKFLFTSMDKIQF